MLGVISLEVCTKQVRPGVRGELAKVFRERITLLTHWDRKSSRHMGLGKGMR